MKLTSFKYFSYNLIFSNDFITSKGKSNHRKIFIIVLKDESDRLFYGEAAPLPQFNSESYQEVENELKRLSRIQTFECKNSLQDVFDYVNSLSSFSTIKYAFEQIFLTCLFLNDIKASHNFSSAKDINVNTVLDIKNFETSKMQLKKLVEKGFTVIKLKADNNNFNELYNLIAWSFDEIEYRLKFRIDPNGSWEKKNTIIRSNKLELLPVEYIEQPVNNINDLVKISFESPIPIAVDESVRNLNDAEILINNSNIKFFVIKPMLFGGISNLIELTNLVEGRDIQLIISSSLESNIGRRHLVLSSSIIDNNLAHGLGTSEMFTNQPTDDIFPVNNGMIDYSLKNYLSPINLR